jgi:hypothetical protein
MKHLIALAVGLVTALAPAAPASAATHKPKLPGIGGTIVIPANPGAYGSYAITLVQVYDHLTYYSTKGIPGNPVIARFRVLDTGSASVDEDPQQDANTLMVGHEYPTKPVVEYNWKPGKGQTGKPETNDWQLEADFLANNGNGSFWALGGPVAKGCPTVPLGYSPFDNVSDVRTFSSAINLIPGADTQACVAFSLGLYKTTAKICWTPDAAVPLQQPTYCWTFENQ